MRAFVVGVGALRVGMPRELSMYINSDIASCAQPHQGDRRPVQGAAARVSGKCGKAYRGDCTWVIGWPPAGSVPGGIWAEEGSNDYLGYAPIDFQRDPRLL